MHLLQLQLHAAHATAALKSSKVNIGLAGNRQRSNVKSCAAAASPQRQQLAAGRKIDNQCGTLHALLLNRHNALQR
jgi:hypothetical protein